MASASSRSGELDRLKRAELAGIPMTFAGPGKRDEELEAGIAAGATISVESEGEARRAILAGEKLGIQPEDRGPGQPAVLDRGWQASRWALGRARSGSMPSAPPRSSRACSKPVSTGAGCTSSPASQCLDDAALIEAHKAIVALRRRHRQRARHAASPSSTSAAGSTCPASTASSRSTSIASPPRFTRPCAPRPSCSRPPGCRSSSAAGWSPRRASI